METIKLPAEVDDVARCLDLNQRLRAAACVLDWSDVTALDEPAARVLLAGLNASDHADALGVDTMADGVADQVTRWFSEGANVPLPKARTKKAPTSTKAGAADDVGPALWAPGPEPEPDFTPAREPPKPLLHAPPPEELRAALEEAVVRDLLGPAGGPEEEITDPSVRDRYLVGMLAPQRLRTPSSDNDRLALQEQGGAEEGEEDGEEPAEPTMFPSALGLSFMVDFDAGPLRVTARWGRYVRAASTTLETETGRPRMVWKRTPVEAVVELPPLSEGPVPEHTLAFAAADSAHEAVVLRGVAHVVPRGVVVSLFLVNCQDEPEERRDEGWLFQPELHVEAVSGAPVFLARPRHELSGDDAEGRGMAMLYRERVEFAVGHSVAAHAEPWADDPRRATRLETRVVPGYEIASTDTPGPTTTRCSGGSASTCASSPRRPARTSPGSSAPSPTPTPRGSPASARASAPRARASTASTPRRGRRSRSATRCSRASATAWRCWRATSRPPRRSASPTARCGCSACAPASARPSARARRGASTSSTSRRSGRGACSSSPSSCSTSTASPTSTTRIAATPRTRWPTCSGSRPAAARPRRTWAWRPTRWACAACRARSRGARASTASRC
jgi:hypothetical protein